MIAHVPRIASSLAIDQGSKKSSLPGGSTTGLLGTRSANEARLCNASTNDTTEPPKKRVKTAAPQKIVIRPSDYVMAAFKANGVVIEDARSNAAKKFRLPTEEMIAAYQSDLLNAARRNDIGEIKRLHKEGKLINCCNKFGDSLLHLACRRSHTEIARYLIEEVKVDIHIRDDYHRTPLHDAAWTPEPNFELVSMLMKIAPEHLLLEDVRGFTPFDYVQKQHWGKWLRFLWERKKMLRVAPDDAP